MTETTLWSEAWRDGLARWLHRHDYPYNNGLFPSLEYRHARPHGWIQWKGTEVCADIYCKCGKQWHMDESFMYHIKCPHCGQVYECDGHFALFPLAFEPEGTKYPDPDEFGIGEPR